MLLVAALMRISEVETKIYRYEKKLHQYKKQSKLSLFNTLRQKMFGKSFKK